MTLSLNPPACPVTGQPAVRLVQTVSTRFLARLWEIVFKADARPSFKGLEQVALWESPTGLHFFDPPMAGDGDFYRAFYKSAPIQTFLKGGADRAEFQSAARHVPDQANLLDYGCGYGVFQHVVPQARYTGLDPYFSGDPSTAPNVHLETLSDHLVTHRETYDVATAFQVMEHVEQPAILFRQLAAAVKPGGRIIIGVPHVPSAPTRIPNFLVNAPPHHLTWWTKAALAALAEQAGCHVESVEPFPWCKIDSIAYWIARCSPVRCREVFYRHALSWHASALVGFIAGVVMNTLMGPPKRPNDEGGGLILVARKPA